MVTKDCCAAATWHWGSTGLLQILATDCDAHFQVFDSEHEHEHEYERSTSTSTVSISDCGAVGYYFSAGYCYTHIVERLIHRSLMLQYE